MKKLLVLLAACLFVFGVTSVYAADHTLRIVHLSNTNDEDYDGALTFKDYVEARSNGKIVVEVYPGAQLCGNAGECYEATQGNVIQIHQMTIGGISVAFPELQVMDLPYMMDNDSVAEEVLTGPFLNVVRQHVLKKGGPRIMTMTNTGGWRNIANTKRQVKSPADMKGLRIRTINSPLQQTLVKNLGASATPVAWPEVYTSLATGVIDGSKNGITDIVGMKFHEHIKHVTLDGHAYMASLWIMNEDAYQALDNDQKRIVNDGFAHLGQVCFAFPKRRAISAYEEFKKAGGTIYVPTPAEKDAFRAAAEPLQKWYTDKYGAEGAELLKAYKAAIVEAEEKLDAKLKLNM
ncbi:MAG: C4-dicarboxylate ABC transporter substrate-binding protein [Desulfobulbaceae bacterium]|nr:MAG: C4-dicarboxylate ABC transporter substrate-binding protein [Desulfobulbaceae bacterium]